MKLFNENTPLLMVPNFDDLDHRILPYNPFKYPVEEDKEPIDWITC